uniref:ORF6 n=2 Tax=Barley yellow dwarf virus (isolate PAV) TaxID=2169986 RepID=A0A2L0E9A4_BYDVP|nr:ORF6 [Barley yellow dwarf virus PAV]AUX14007.1 ORF6 [Barley yellow dwarf virus PAV]
MEDLHVIAACMLALTVLSGVGAILSCCKWCFSTSFPSPRASLWQNPFPGLCGKQPKISGSSGSVRGLTTLSNWLALADMNNPL